MKTKDKKKRSAHSIGTLGQFMAVFNEKGKNRYKEYGNLKVKLR